MPELVLCVLLYTSIVAVCLRLITIVIKNIIIIIIIIISCTSSQ